MIFDLIAALIPKDQYWQSMFFEIRVHIGASPLLDLGNTAVQVERSNYLHGNKFCLWTEIRSPRG